MRKGTRRNLCDAVELQSLIRLTELAKALRVPRSVVTRKLLAFLLENVHEGDFILNAGHWVEFPCRGKLTIGRPGLRKLDEVGNQRGMKLGSIEFSAAKGANKRRRLGINHLP